MKYIIDVEGLDAALAHYDNDQPSTVAIDTETTPYSRYIAELRAIINGKEADELAKKPGKTSKRVIKNPAPKKEKPLPFLSVHSNEIRLLQISWVTENEVNTYIFDIFKLGRNLRLFSPILENPSVNKLFYNAKFDLNMLRRSGVNVVKPVSDIMVMFGVCYNGVLPEAGLNLANAYNTIIKPLTPMTKETKTEGQRSDWGAETLTELQLEYAGRDTEVLLEMFPILQGMLRKMKLTHIVNRIEMPAMWATADMEYRGIPIDAEVFKTMRTDLEPQVKEYESRVQAVFEAVGVPNVNLNSPKQVIEAFKALGITVTGRSRSVLLTVDHPVIMDMLQYYEKFKLLGFVKSLPTFIDPATKRIHCSIKLLGARTGRTSCVSPNLQQIPRSDELRGFIKADEGYDIIVCDYSQIEIVIATEITKDATLIKAFNEGVDVHKITASMILNKPIEEVKKSDRQLAKAVNFGWLYGMGAAKLVIYGKDSFGVVMTLEQAQDYRSKFFETYPGLKAWHNECSSEIKYHNPEYVETLSGRKRLFDPSPFSPNAIRFTSYVNTQDQGTGGDITKRALCLCAIAFEGTGVNVILQVHDEIVIESPKSKSEWAKATLERCMIEAGKEFIHSIPVAVEAKIASTWAQAK